MTFENLYYRVETIPSRQRPGWWSSWAQVIRKDSGEIVDSIRARGLSAEEADALLRDKILALMPKLDRPSDWGRDPVPVALVKR